jgi:hypothetical protein
MTIDDDDDVALVWNTARDIVDQQMTFTLKDYLDKYISL